MLRLQNSMRMLLCLTVACAWAVDTSREATARTTLRNICRVKGQEENVLRGLGLVVGLSGTGEVNDPQTMRALGRAMEIMGSPIPQTGLLGAGSLSELKKVKNTALVIVTAHVPASGARRGDKLDCVVSAINGKSLAGGQLASAVLQGPNVGDNRVYALAEGRIQLDSEDTPLVGRIHQGCQMEEDVFTPFEQDGYITLIVDKNHADFQIASEIAGIIQDTHFPSDEDGEQVQAINQSNIRVKIPEEYKTVPVEFVANLLELRIYQADPEARVVIDEISGSIVVSGDVQIGDVVISHPNVLVEVAEENKPFVKLDQEKVEPAKLDALLDALNALKIPSADRINIIKSIERSGKLHGKLIIE